MPVGLRDSKIREDHDEDKDVVHAQGILDEIASEKFERPLRSAEVIDAGIKGQGEEDPHQAPQGRLFFCDDAGVAVEYP